MGYTLRGTTQASVIGSKGSPWTNNQLVRKVLPAMEHQCGTVAWSARGSPPTPLYGTDPALTRALSGRPGIRGAPGTLYPVLRSLEENGFWRAGWSRR